MADEKEVLETCAEDGGRLSWDADWGEWICDTCSAEYDDREVRPQLQCSPVSRGDA